MCPRTRYATRLPDCFKELRAKYPEALFLLDPNFCVSAIGAQKKGQLETYPFFPPQLRRSDFTPRKMQEHVRKVVDYQVDIDASAIVSPGLIIPSFTHANAQINLQLFDETHEYVAQSGQPRDVLFCLPIAESALREEEQMQEYLADLTRLEGKGFYIFVERSTENSLWWSDPITLSNFMHLVYALNANGYEVYVGYTDLAGVLFEAVGATGLANGWWRSTRQFAQTRFEERFGRRPRPQYTSVPLLSAVFVDPELQSIYEQGAIDEVISHSGFDDKLVTNPVGQSWEPDQSALHNWAVLDALCKEVGAGVDMPTRLALLRGKIASAQGLYAKLKAAGVPFDPSTNGSHLRVWEEAIMLFEQSIS